MTTLAKITQLRDQLSASEQRIADQVLDKPEHVVSLSSQQLAEQTQVSQSSVVKFSQKIGFKGFTAFKLALSEELGRKKAIIGTNEKRLHNQITQGDSLADMAHKLVQEKTNAIMETTHALDYRALKQVVELLDQAGRVQLVGIGGSALTAKDLGYKLLKIGVPTLAELDSHVQISIAQTLGERDIQLVLSYSGQRKEVLVAAESAKRHGATVVAITSVQPSPLRDIADICIDTLGENSACRSSAIASRTAQNTVIDLLFMALVQKRDQLANTLISETQAVIESLRR